MQKKIGSKKPIPVQNPNILCPPSRVVVHSTFPIQPGFAITVEKAQGQILDRVIVALSERKQKLSTFQYACLYVALSRVRLRKHLRIILKKDSNQAREWESLIYISNLKPIKSIKAFFAGYSKDRTNWLENEWDSHSALDYYNQ